MLLIPSRHGPSPLGGCSVGCFLSLSLQWTLAAECLWLSFHILTLAMPPGVLALLYLELHGDFTALLERHEI